MQQPKVYSLATRRFYFISGIVATIAYRIIIVLTNVDQVWVKLAWYVGTVGFIIYFIHRFEVSERREKVIVERDLAKKVEKIEGIDEEDRSALLYILKSLSISSERWNYILIFVTSGLALIYGIWVDFIR